MPPPEALYETLPPVAALNRNFKSQIAARYAALWHAVPNLHLDLFPLVPLNRSVFKTQKLQTLAFHKSQRFSATKVLSVCLASLLTKEGANLNRLWQRRALHGPMPV